MPPERSEASLILAVIAGNITAVSELLLQAGSDKINDHFHLTPLGDTALIWACHEGYLDIVKLILFHHGKSHINHQSRNGSTALHAAANGGHLSIVQRLLRVRGIRIDLHDQEGMTPLMRAEYSGHRHVVEEFVRSQYEAPSFLE